MMKMRTGNIISVLLYHLGLLCCVRLCTVKVNDIPVQSDFIYDNFTESAWNTVKYNRFIKIKGIPKLYSNSDQTTLFGWKDAQPIVTNIARFGFAPGRNMCVSDTGTVEFLDNKPAKMFLKYRNKKTGQTHEQNQWVLYTDYKNLAIMYACEDKLQLDGLCESKHRYIWILAKKTTLTEAEDQKAKAMAASVCITETLKSIDHKHPCNQQITM